MPKIDKASGEREQDTSVQNCPSCGAVMEFDPKTAGLLCPHCGRVLDIKSETTAEKSFEKLLWQEGDWDAETVVYQCNNCSAKEVISKKDIARECPYCGTTNIVKARDLPGLRPDTVVPYAITMDEAAGHVRKWIKGRPFAPKWYKTAAAPQNMHGVYMPAFTFDTKTTSVYSGTLVETYHVTVEIDGQTTTETRYRRTPIYGDIAGNFNDILIPASEQVPPKMFSGLKPFDTDGGKAYKKEFLFGYTASQYTKNGMQAWEEAQVKINADTESEIRARYPSGTIENLQVQTACRGTTYKYSLVPVYIGHSSYKDKNYNFYVNGVSGKIAGKAPISKWKLFFTAAGLVSAIVGLIVLAMWLSM